MTRMDSYRSTRCAICSILDAGPCGTDVIAERLGLRRRQVINAVRDLCREGYLERGVKIGRERTYRRTSEPWRSLYPQHPNSLANLEIGRRTPRGSKGAFAPSPKPRLELERAWGWMAR